MYALSLLYHHKQTLVQTYISPENAARVSRRHRIRARRIVVFEHLYDDALIRSRPINSNRQS